MISSRPPSSGATTPLSGRAAAVWSCACACAAISETPASSTARGARILKNVMKPLMRNGTEALDIPQEWRRFVAVAKKFHDDLRPRPASMELQRFFHARRRRSVFELRYSPGAHPSLFRGTADGPPSSPDD